MNGPEEANNELLDKENIQPGPSHMSVENCPSEQMGQHNKQDKPSNVSFKDLLLKTVKQNATRSSSTKKRRVAIGAEVITHQNLDD
ncbi:hypothetical protein QE152_g35919 [Popillia japonica]|uniref:Uncharacterized protein n=1 Tax=Popillia japonica TaxID=7064 RepID=A0AAW1IEN1_POPJA